MNFKRILSALVALSGVLILLWGTMIDHDRYREKLIQQPVRLVSNTLTVAVQTPGKIRDRILLLEIKTICRQDHKKATIILNENELGRVSICGHSFIKIPKKMFHDGVNNLLLRGLPAGETLAVLEMKNIYGYSRGLLGFIIIPSDSRSVRRLPWLLALPLAFLFLLTILFAPKIMSAHSKNHVVRWITWIIAIFFIVVLAVPFFISSRIFLNLSMTLLFLGMFYLPGLGRLSCLIARFFQFHFWPWLKMCLQHLRLGRRERLVLAVLALATIFIFFSVHRQRYVGAADWYGYYAESLLFRQGQLTMKTAFPAEQYPAFAPLGFYAVGNKIIPQYPPGFPLLLALFGLLGMEFFVNALAGVLTILILYLILKNSVSRGMALLYALLWTFFPVTVFISIRMMSDLIATLFILLTYYLFTRNKIFWSGVAFSYAVVVRPSCVLFFIIFLPLLFKKKQFWKFCFSGAIIGSLYGLYNWAVFGKPWMTGYGGFANELTGGVFWHHFIYYGRTMLIIMTPLLIIPALLPLVRRKPRSWFYFTWLASFWIFYSFWKSGGDSWWYLRFLLPGLPALFIISAIGMQDIRERLLAWKPRCQPLLNAVAVLILLIMLPYFNAFSERNLVYTADKGEMYFQACKKMQSMVPPDALVGGLEMSGPIRLYTGLESFRWDLPESLVLIRDFLKKGRPLYLLIEPWSTQHPAIKEIAETFQLKKIAVMPDHMGTQLAKLALRQE